MPPDGETREMRLQRAAGGALLPFTPWTPGHLPAARGTRSAAALHRINHSHHYHSSLMNFAHPIMFPEEMKPQVVRPRGNVVWLWLYIFNKPYTRNSESHTNFTLLILVTSLFFSFNDVKYQWCQPLIMPKFNNANFQWYQPSKCQLSIMPNINHTN